MTRLGVLLLVATAACGGGASLKPGGAAGAAATGKAGGGAGAGDASGGGASGDGGGGAGGSAGGAGGVASGGADAAGDAVDAAEAASDGADAVDDGGTRDSTSAEVGGDALVCQPVLNQAGIDTGFEVCSDHSQRRRVAIACPEARMAATSPCTPDDGPACKSDAECTMQPLGYCANAHKLVGYCGCFYGCRKDSDCASGSICSCGSVVGVCVSATCASAAECGAGSACVLTVHGAPQLTCVSGRPSSFVESYSCLKPEDQCHGNGDCPSSGMDFGTCFIDTAHRYCGLTCFSV